MTPSRSPETADIAHIPSTPPGGLMDVRAFVILVISAVVSLLAATWAGFIAAEVAPGSPVAVVCAVGAVFVTTLIPVASGLNALVKP